MGKRIYDTYHASFEETEALKAELDKADIDYYETFKGSFGLGNAGLWVKDSQDYEAARQVIEAFQPKWIEQVRKETGQNQGINWRYVPALLMVIIAVLFLTFYFY